MAQPVDRVAWVMILSKGTIFENNISGLTNWMTALYVVRCSVYVCDRPKLIHDFLVLIGRHLPRFSMSEN
jgi:hypothetical protein